MKFAIATEHLVLRKLGEEDLDALVELDSDPEVMRYINDGRAELAGALRRELAAPHARVGGGRSGRVLCCDP